MSTHAIASPDPPSQGRRRVRWLAIFLVAGLVIGFDLCRPPAKQWSARVLLSAIDLYQATLSPLMPVAGVRCRFAPTCSHYGEAAIAHHGTLVGGAKTAWRILRCGPWTPAGTHDPVEPRASEPPDPVPSSDRNSVTGGGLATTRRAR